MKLRRLNEKGIDQFQKYIESLRGNTPAPYPVELLSDREATEEILPDIEVEQQSLSGRFEAGEYLHTILKDSGLVDIDFDVGLWSWLALYFFDDICPKKKRERKGPGELARFILRPNDWRFSWRHLLAGPYSIFRNYRKDPEVARILLYGPVHGIPKSVSQFLSRMRWATNEEVLATATKLYIQPESKSLKRGSTGQVGGIERFQAVLKQFDCTWDLYSMSRDGILDMLPREFDKFKQVG